MSRADLQQRLRDFLQAHQVMTLAVDGPYAAAVFYAVDQRLNLYFVTDPRTRHGAALLRHPRVAGTIQRDRQGWRDARGVQFTGQCRRLRGLQRLAGWRHFVRRFEFAAGPDLLPALARVDLWKIEPDWMRLIDNAVRFGHKEEWTPRSSPVDDGSRPTRQQHDATHARVSEKAAKSAKN
jgi:uncharacterized protein YhbP (UPF0306 family)